LQINAKHGVKALVGEPIVAIKSCYIDQTLAHVLPEWTLRRRKPARPLLGACAYCFPPMNSWETAGKLAIYGGVLSSRILDQSLQGLAVDRVSKQKGNPPLPQKKDASRPIPHLYLLLYVTYVFVTRLY
jgi:hypothetical protein